MAISEATRAEVWRLDHGECIFWHREPVAATDPSHFIHQGAGGLPPSHWINQPPNIGASCRPCHDRFSGPGKPYKWTAFDRAKGIMQIVTPRGRLVPREELWFYNRARWEKTQGVFKLLQRDAARERRLAWNVAWQLLWLQSRGIAGAVNLSSDWLDLAAQVGLTSSEARKRVRVVEEVGSAMPAGIDLDVADRLRKIETEEELQEVAGWFAELSPAEAWARFSERYPGKERRKRYRAFTGGLYREVEAATEREALEQLGGQGIIVKGGSVIQGIRQQEAK